MPQDPIEIELALRAAKVAWEKYSYLEHRYGERGRRFTDSDSCWLFTLARAPREVVVTNSLEWLRRVLAVRGIPTVILEFHLMAIVLAIESEFPEQPIKKIQFFQFLADRKAERRRLVGAESRSLVVDVFDQRFRACTGFKVELAAELITSAWVDEQSGISGSLAALCNWFTDGERFSKVWVAIVHELLLELDRVHGQSR